METFCLLLYQILLALLLLVAGPFLLVKPKTRAGLFEKFGFLSKAFVDGLSSQSQAVWFHAVSVGEFNAIYPFIQAFHEKYPGYQIVVSTTTETGNKLARERTGNFAEIFYFPFDFAIPIRRAISVIKPSLVVIVETELWPFFATECRKQSIPIAILNGRMSPRSARTYEKLKLFFGPVLRNFSLIGAQSEVEESRYRRIGGNNLSIKVFGNLKYDNFASINPEEILSLRSKTNVDSKDMVLLAGSTHEREEDLVLNVLNRYRQDFGPNSLKLIVAPRHPERFGRVQDIVQNAGYRARLFSKGEAFELENDVLIIDTIGSLSKMYGLATVAFVGGTIANVGGHNLLEPYAFSVAAACGPRLFKTKDTAAILTSLGALLVGKSSSEVESLLFELLTNADMRKRKGEIGRKWLTENQGAVERALHGVADLLPDPQTKGKQMGSGQYITKAAYAKGSN
jgi:3-deoxy-D-manno-octulosonic-acid transferase